MPSRSAPARDGDVSVIIPAYNAAAAVGRCVAAIARAGPGCEILVVDDGSTDETAAAARAQGARVISADRNAGCSAARNLGVENARGGILFFVDADVVIAADAVERVAAALAPGTGFDAVFGSYDASPDDPGWVSQYRNLLHHHTHQIAHEPVTTFWCGCGAIRRSAFEAVGGFDASAFPAPSVEDIELGYRLIRAGYRIRFDKALQGTHLKRWTLASMVRTDLFARAIPWSRLIFSGRASPRGLNLRASQRLSVVCAVLLIPALALTAAGPVFALLPVLLLAAVVALNHSLFRLLHRRHGPAFALFCLALHLIHYGCGAAGYGWAWAEQRCRLRPAA